MRNKKQNEREKKEREKEDVFPGEQYLLFK